MQLNEKMLELGSKRSIIREIFEYSKSRANEIGAENVFDFSLGNPSVEPPREINETIKELCDSKDANVLHGYTSAQGDAQTRKTISQNLNKRFDVNIDENHIYMTCGAAASLTISLKAVINENEEVIVFAPFFTEYRVFVQNAGGKLVVSNPNQATFQIDFADFESRITKNTRAVIINSPNNPSGVVYNEKTIRKLCEILEKYEQKYNKTIYLITDEPYRELVYEGVFVPYIMNYYKDTIVCYSYSKALSLPGDRIGYIAVSPKCKDDINVYLAICGAGRSLGYVCAPSMFQHLITKCDGLVSDVTKYAENRKILYTSLTQFGFKCIKPDGAFYLFMKSPEEDAYKFFEKAKKYEILVVPCDDFGVKGYVRIAYCVSKDRIINSLPAFNKLAKEYNLN